ncbi:unnamed protein product, partial [marine sediment metagenome]
MLSGGEEHAVGFYLMYVPNWGGKGDIAYRVGLALLQDFNTLKIILQVRENNRLTPQGISRGEQPAVSLESTLGHRLNHNICICRMVQVAVRQDDGAEFIGSELPFSGLDYGAGTG